MDTSEKIAKLFHNMLMSRSGEERLKMGCNMHEAAKRLVIASILASNPQASQQELRRDIFLRFYENDFSAEVKKKFLHLLKYI